MAVTRETNIREAAWPVSRGVLVGVFSVFECGFGKAEDPQGQRPIG